MNKISGESSIAGERRLAAWLIRSAIRNLRKPDRSAFRHADVPSVHQADLDWLNEVDSGPFSIALVGELWGMDPNFIRSRVAKKAVLERTFPGGLLLHPVESTDRTNRIAELRRQEKYEFLIAGLSGDA